jgi:hypothetical protein
MIVCGVFAAPPEGEAVRHCGPRSEKIARSADNDDRKGLTQVDD